MSTIHNGGRSEEARATTGSGMHLTGPTWGHQDMKATMARARKLAANAEAKLAAEPADDLAEVS